MTKSIRFIAAMTALIIAVSAGARDFTYQGIIYTVQDEDAKTCHTKAGIMGFMQAPKPGNSVSGEVVIPAQASDGNDVYTVVGLGDVAFLNCTGLTSVDLPATVTQIG
ncbi:MAG: leucine-rich repeat domain-containing protein, partial [Muribaculaceae bacterium]|nr:leucine-rich repeat domain-containing protein [Muribaculaceae bacterium]